MKTKILVIGHACGPGLGSEPGNTWHWAQTLSRTNQVWVLAYPEYRPAVEEYLDEHPNPNLHFVWVVSNHFLDPWRPGGSERGIRFHYVLWLKEAYRQAVQLCELHAIDVVHHVSWGTVGAAPPLGKLLVPVVWGPVGGGQTSPPSFLPFFQGQRWAEMLRTARVQLLKNSRKLQSAARRADLILATNDETYRLLRSVGGLQTELSLDCGLAGETIPTALSWQARPEEFTLLWAGRLEYRKGLTLALEAMSQLSESPVRLLIAGKGPQETYFKAEAARLGLNRSVEFLGPVPHPQMPALFQSSSAFLFTSLRDSFGSVVLEAMSFGLPIVSLDHQGVGTFLRSDAAVKIPVSTPGQTVKDFADSIRSLSLDRLRCESMSMAAWRFAQEQTWEKKVQRALASYRRLLEANDKAAEGHSSLTDVSRARDQYANSKR